MKEPPFATKIWTSLFILAGLLLVGIILAAMFSSDAIEDANVAIIQISGPIMATSDASIFSDSVASSSGIVEMLEEARDDPDIEAVILEINSPGGSAVASDEVARAVKDVRASGKPVVAWVREVGASGAYWIASSSDHIVANRMSITGSIGVIASYIEFAEFLDEWNLTYNRLVAGERKDIGDPFQELSENGEEFMQEKLDVIHGIFIQEVAANRNMSVAEMQTLADGRFFLGIEAYDAGLVDELGGKPEAIAYLEERLDTEVTTTEYEDDPSLVDLLFGTKHTGLAIEQSVVPMAR